MNNFLKKNVLKKKYILRFKNVSFLSGDDVILKNVSFNINKGEFVSILGPSGCGKTTTLRLIAGFEELREGLILFEEKNINRFSIQKRPINTIFQNYALFEFKTVYENITFSLKAKNYSKIIILEKFKKLVKFLDLKKFYSPNFLNKYPDEISGGEKQLTSILRALMNLMFVIPLDTPKILLLDEPLSALDSEVRKKMQKELKRIQKKLGITFIMVTHNHEEAFFLSDLVIVMSNGQIQQIDTPENIYNCPINSWVAKFVGSTNIIEDACFIHDNLVAFDQKTFFCTDVGFGENEKGINVLIRPEDLQISSSKEAFFIGEIKSTNFKGLNWEIIIISEEGRLFVVHTTFHHHVGKKIGIRWEDDAIHIMWKEEYEII